MYTSFDAPILKFDLFIKGLLIALDSLYLVKIS